MGVVMARDVIPPAANKESLITTFINQKPNQVRSLEKSHWFFSAIGPFEKLTPPTYMT